MKLLADTSALVALFSRRERNHEPAAQFLRRDPRTRFVVSDLILSETVTLLRLRADAERAVVVGRELARSRRFDLHFLDSATLEGALERLARFSDKRLSLADCASFDLIDRLKLDGAFTFDRDFRDCGYAVVP